MNRSVFSAVLLIACSGAMADTSPGKMRVIGEWSGRGETVGKAFSACARFTPHMDDIYLKYDYRVRYDAAGGLPAQRIESYYHFLENGKVEGVSLDSLSNVFQIEGSYQGNGLSTRWLKNGKTAGKSDWQLSANGKTLKITRFGLLANGEFKEISTVTMTRVPAGKNCMQ